MVEKCGPLMNYSQFWVERFIRFIMHILHATIRSAEAMNETVKMTERVKIYFGTHFAPREDRSTGGHTDGDDEEGMNYFDLLFPRTWKC